MTKINTKNQLRLKQLIPTTQLPSRKRTTLQKIQKTIATKYSNSIPYNEFYLQGLIIDLPLVAAAYGTSIIKIATDYDNWDDSKKENFLQTTQNFIQSIIDQQQDKTTIYQAITLPLEYSLFNEPSITTLIFEQPETPINLNNLNKLKESDNQLSLHCNCLNNLYIDVSKRYIEEHQSIPTSIQRACVLEFAHYLERREITTPKANQFNAFVRQALLDRFVITLDTSKQNITKLIDYLYSESDEWTVQIDWAENKTTEIQEPYKIEPYDPNHKVYPFAIFLKTDSDNNLITCPELRAEYVLYSNEPSTSRNWCRYLYLENINRHNRLKQATLYNSENVKIAESMPSDHITDELLAIEFSFKPWTNYKIIDNTI